MNSKSLFDKLVEYEKNENKQGEVSSPTTSPSDPTAKTPQTPHPSPKERSDSRKEEVGDQLDRLLGY